MSQHDMKNEQYVLHDLHFQIIQQKQQLRGKSLQKK